MKFVKMLSEKEVIKCDRCGLLVYGDAAKSIAFELLDEDIFFFCSDCE